MPATNKQRGAPSVERDGCTLVGWRPSRAAAPAAFPSRWSPIAGERAMRLVVLRRVADQAAIVFIARY